MSEPADAQLLTAWRAGDQAAGQALMGRHYATVLRFFELNASWVAEDLAQRTFMAAIERADQVRDAGAFRAYLLGIARRQLAMHMRRLAHTNAMASFDAPQQPRERTGMSTLVARNDQQMLVLRAMAAMPRAGQALLILYYWEGVRTPALAEIYGLTESGIRNRLDRARQRLRKKLEVLSQAGGWVAGADDESLDLLMKSVLPTGGTLLRRPGSPTR